MKESASYPMFASYFRKQIKPALKDYVVHAAHLKDVEPNWTNNNCESLNHIMKLDAKWKPGNTPQMIILLHDIVALHFKDFQRALYGSGNYRLVKNQRVGFNIPKDTRRKMNDEDNEEVQSVLEKPIQTETHNYQVDVRHLRCYKTIDKTGAEREGESC